MSQWSVLEDDYVDEASVHDTTHICVECGEIEYHQDVHWEDDEPLCDYCYVNLFGEES